MIHLKDNPNFIRKLFSVTRKIVLVTGKLLLVHIGWIFIAREETNHVTGSAPCVAGKNNLFVRLKNISCDKAK